MNAFASVRPKATPAPTKPTKRYVRGEVFDATTQAIFGKPRMYQITLENREVGRANTERRRAVAKASI